MYMFEVEIKMSKMYFKFDKIDYCPSHFCIPYSLKVSHVNHGEMIRVGAVEYITEKEVTFTD